MISLARWLLPLFVLFAAVAPAEAPRVCGTCKKRKPAEEFPSAGRGRRRGVCRDCYNAAARERRAASSAPSRNKRKRAEQRHGPAGAESAAQRVSLGGRVIAWVETHCVFTKGRFRGKPFRLQPWQKRLIWELFELREMNAEERAAYEIPDQEPAFIRKVRQAYISIAKKNGKTELLAAIALWFLIDDDEPAPEIVCAAASGDQADLAFGAAKIMCEESRTLRRITKCWDESIEVPSKPGAVLKRLAVGGGKLDGANLYVVLIDELHEWLTVNQLATYRVLTNGVTGRIAPLILQITTAGHDQESICYRQYEYAKKVATGEIEDPSYYGFIREAPEELSKDRDYLSEEAFNAANPSAGVTVFYTSYLDEAKHKPEHEMRRYKLNQWTETEAAWLPVGSWADCRSDLEFDPVLEFVACIDSSTKADSTAIVLLQPRAAGEDEIGLNDGDGLDVVRSRIWERPINPMTNEPLEGWRLPIEEVKKHLRSMHHGTGSSDPADTWCEAGFCACGCGMAFAPGRCRSIGYDPAFITWVAIELGADGLPMVEIPQTAARMVPGSQGLYERVVQRRIAHNGDPGLTRHIRNAVAKQSSNGGWRLAKDAARRLMDASIALAMCIYLVSRPEEEKPAEKKPPNIW